MCFLAMLCLMACEKKKSTYDDLMKQKAFEKKDEIRLALSASHKYTATIIDQMPDSLFLYKPTPEVMHFAEQFRHCAVFTCNQLAGRFELESPYHVTKPVVDLDKAGTLQEINRMYDFMHEVLEGLPPEKLFADIAFGQETLPAWRLFYAMENHIIHHRGQCIIYLRLNAVKPVGYFGW